MSDTTRLRKRAAVATVAAAAIGPVAAPAIFPAPAAASPSCPGNTLCEWEDGGFNSAVAYWPHDGFSDYISDYRQFVYNTNHSQSLNDSISAVWNNAGRWVKFYRNPGFSGLTLCLSPGAAVSDLTTVTLPGEPQNNWSNRISGHTMHGSQPSGCDTTRTGQGCSV